MAGKDSEGRSDISASTKKRRPPEFRHLPRDRAKKLRKDWIEKKKIKARWKHEKRKGSIQWPEDDTEQLEETAETTTSDAQLLSDIDKDSRSIMAHASSAEPERNNKSEQVTTKTPMPPPPQINRTHHPIRDADKKRRSIDKRKSEFGTGRRRPTTMREKMGLLLEKIQKNLDST